MDTASFHIMADAIFADLLDAIEIADEDGNIEVDIEDGILNIALPDGQEYVINKHESSTQIWMSSPVSGASRYDYHKDEDEWINARGWIFRDTVSEELSQVTDIDVEF